MASKTKAQKAKTTFECTECGYVARSFLGRCPVCEAWGSLSEVVTEAETTSKNRVEQQTQSLMSASGQELKPVSMADVVVQEGDRVQSGIAELDRVLGGGVLPGSYVLIGGEPGMGKSTLMLQASKAYAEILPSADGSDMSVLYVAGEESPAQIRQRAERLGCVHAGVYLYGEARLNKIIERIQADKPPLVVIDSIQAIYNPELTGTPGSVNQVKDCAMALMHVAKLTDTIIFLIGHVTKDGQLSGPKVLEHLVDTVCAVEGERYQDLRLLRTTKNRFGSTQTLGAFEMTAEGLHEVANPSAWFLSELGAKPAPGQVLTATMQGSRSLIVEIQALVGRSTYSVPRRMANGVDVNRVHKILAILERRMGFEFANQDVYVNVVGGIKLDDPAVDLAIAMALVSSLREKSLRDHVVVLGELGLTGEVRSVRQLNQRLAEAASVGMTHGVVPKAGLSKRNEVPKNVTLLSASTLMDAIQACFPAVSSV